MSFGTDFNNAAPQGQPPGLSWGDRKTRVKQAAEGQPQTIIMHLWPAARALGDDLVVGDVTGRPGQSCKVRVKGEKVGVWSDFAGDEKGADLIDLWQAVHRVDFKTAVAEMESFLALDITGRPTVAPPPAPAKAKTRDVGIPTQTWTYYSPDKVALATITRYETDDGKKEFRPWSVADAKYTHPTPRPLYNLPLIKDAPRVILVEGEKCADALAGAGFTAATTTMGGSNAPTNKTDWAPLTGKQVVIWPDNDAPGLKYAEAAKMALEQIGCPVMILEPPADKPAKWDAADAVEEGFDLNGFLTLPEIAEPALDPFDKEIWKARHLDLENPPERQWLVHETFPMGTVSILAAAGDSGKGMLTLDLAAKVAGGPSIDPSKPVLSLGSRVTRHGEAVIFSAEDDLGEIHRRLAGIVDRSKWHIIGERLHVVPLPNAGGPFPLVISTPTGLTEGPGFWKVKAHLESFEDLALVVFDPMASFVAADINADPQAGAMVMATLATLGQSTGAAVMMIHHLSKGSFERPIKTPEQARHMIRGSTALVDGVRAAYTLWPAPESIARDVCKALGREWAPNAVFQGALVKTNGPGDRHVKTFLRNQNNGLLEVVDAQLEAMRRHLDYKQILELDIKRLAESGRPITKDGAQGVYSRRNELSEEVRDLGRDKLQGIVQALLMEERIDRFGTTTSKALRWLDVPGGEFYEGRGELLPGFIEG